jgi:hypothetical protein
MMLMTRDQHRGRRAFAQLATEAVNGIRFGLDALSRRQMHDVIETIGHLRLSALDFEL